MKNTLPILAATTFATASTQAATLAEYTFTGESLSVSSELFTGSASDITLGSAWVNSNTPTTDDFLTLNLANSNTNVAAAQNGFSFTYTVSGLSAGEALSLTSIAIEVEETVTRNTVRHSIFVDGLNITGSVDPASFPATIDYDFISADGYSSLSNGDIVTIQYGMRDNEAGTLTADNFILSGEVVAVPEPSSTALLGLGGLALILRRRK